MVSKYQQAMKETLNIMNDEGGEFWHIMKTRFNFDPLVDRDCVYLDGSCKCKHPQTDCRYRSG